MRASPRAVAAQSTGGTDILRNPSVSRPPPTEWCATPLRTSDFGPASSEQTPAHTLCVARSKHSKVIVVPPPQASQHRPNSDQVWWNSGQAVSFSGASLVQVGSSFTDVQPMLVDPKQFCIEESQVWAKSTATIRRFRAVLGHMLPNSGQIWSLRGRTWPSSIEIDRLRPRIGGRRPMFLPLSGERCWPMLVESSPKLGGTEFGPNLAGVGLVSAKLAPGFGQICAASSGVEQNSGCIPRSCAGVVPEHVSTAAYPRTQAHGPRLVSSLKAAV